MKNSTDGTNITVLEWQVYCGIQWLKTTGETVNFCPVCLRRKQACTFPTAWNTMWSGNIYIFFSPKFDKQVYAHQVATVYMSVDVQLFTQFVCGYAIATSCECVITTRHEHVNTTNCGCEVFCLCVQFSAPVYVQDSPLDEPYCSCIHVKPWIFKSHL